MNKLIYSRLDGGVSIVIPAAKKDIERVLGPLTDEEYKQHVIKRSIPKGFQYREVNADDIPVSREFRNAWVDATPESCIDIDCDKAKEIALEKLRQQRNKQLDESDKDMARALEEGDQVEIDALKLKRKSLRDATEPLKQLEVLGKINDEQVLEKIRQLGKI